jgi:hypothetical protein
MCDSLDQTQLPSRVPVFVPVLAGLLLTIANVGMAKDVTLGFGSEQAGTNGIPTPWQLLGNPAADQPEFRVEKDEKYGQVLRLYAKGNQSDGIYRPAVIDLAETPFINFSWKVKIHPKGQVGTDKDDAAVQVQLDFGRHRFKRRVLSYIFDPKAETGRSYDDSSFFAVNRALVLDSGSEKLGEWLSHSRNIAEDYRKCYGTDPPKLENISIFCDSNDSNSESLGYCTGITFSQEPLADPDKAQ